MCEGEGERKICLKLIKNKYKIVKIKKVNNNNSKENNKINNKKILIIVIIRMILKIKM